MFILCPSLNFCINKLLLSVIVDRRQKCSRIFQGNNVLEKILLIAPSLRFYNVNERDIRKLRDNLAPVRKVLAMHSMSSK